MDVAAAAAAALDGAVLHGMPPSPLVADLTQGISVDRGTTGARCRSPAARADQRLRRGGADSRQGTAVAGGAAPART